MKSKVLLIDDSVTIHRVIDLSIDFDRYDIVKVFSKDDAALKIQSEQFDYILLDNKLENIIISEYIAEIKQQQKNAVIILLVGAFDRFDETDLAKTNADDYLVKPFDSQSLNAKLSSDVDMMPAGIVERIAEADFARDNDDYTSPMAAATPVTKQDLSEGITKEVYLENLEEEQPDDLTDTGYVEDKDSEEAESKSAPNIMEETPLENMQAEAQEQPSVKSTVNNMVNFEDLDVEDEEENEEQFMQQADNQDDLPLSSIDLDEPLEVTKSPDLEQVQQEDDLNSLEDVSPVNIEEPVSDISVDDTLKNLDVLSAENNTSENGADLAATDNIEIPDPANAVRNPILPDIEDTADISDEYIMKENLADVDNNHEVLDEFPDFPEVDDVSTDELQDVIDTKESSESDLLNQELPAEDISMQEEEVPDETAQQLKDIQEETGLSSSVLKELTQDEEGLEDAVQQEEDMPEEAPAAEEKPLFDDDDWLNDAPVVSNHDDEVQEESISFDNVEDNVLDNTQEESMDSDDLLSGISAGNDLLEENEVSEPAGKYEDKEQEEQEHGIFSFASLGEDEHHKEEEMLQPAQEENTTDNNEVEDNLFDNTLLEEDKSSDDDIFANNEEISEEHIEDSNVIDENLVAETEEESVFSDNPFENNSEENIEEENSNIFDNADNQEEKVTSFDDNIPVKSVAADNNQTDVKEAETYSPDNNNRFGGITVTISRDEIIAMLGNAIDKSFLEEAVKEVIAANMKEVVRNVVPAIAEKYIKEEIERLKNDE